MNLSLPLFFSTALLFTLSLRAQTIPPGLVHAGYSWDAARRQRLTVSAAEAGLPALILKDFTSLEYYLDPAGKKDIRLFATEHRIVRVNTSEGIERYNKIVVPVLESGGNVEVKARTISPRGEVREVRAADMKELKDENGARGFRVLAVDGVEKGSEVEYYYTREKPFNHFGREVLQAETPARNVTFELIAPAGLTFEVRTYHGPAALIDTSVSGRRILRLSLPNVAGLREEAFAHLKSQQLRVEYKLAYMRNRGQVRQFTFADASQFTYRTMTVLTKDETKAVDKILAAAQVTAGGPLPARLAALENYVKLTYNLDENASNDLSRVLATRNASEIGFCRLLTALSRKLGAAPELVVTSPRDEVPLDAGFDSWAYLSRFALFFPATGQYMAPGRPDLRAGMLPAEWTATPALFVKGVQLGSTESAIGTVREVPALTAEQSPQDLDISVAFAPDLSGSTVQLRQSLGGYAAAVIQPFWSQIPEAKRTEVMQDMQKGVVPDATNFQKLTVSGTERGVNSLTQPFIVEGQLESAALLDKAGPRYLFKIGTLLGPQTELYQQEARQFDVENEHNRSYHRIIRFELPAGYSVRNLQDLNVDVKTAPGAADATRPAFDFRSSYAQQGQQVTVTISENYRQVRWPKTDFEAFRAVVNAAANFNKVVLVLEKKG